MVLSNPKYQKYIAQSKLRFFDVANPEMQAVYQSSHIFQGSAEEKNLSFEQSRSREKEEKNFPWP
jgi:hypothetical protein